VEDARGRISAILARGAPAAPAGAVGVEELLASIRPGDYFAITAYLAERPATQAALDAIRLLVRDRKKVATTLGWGPRSLYSTGQFHKGAGDNGAFLQLTSEPRGSVAIPGRPWGFGEVLAAEAAGDLEALEARGRRIARVHLPADVDRGLEELLAAFGREVVA
jgi:transaldolase / glucose-6-phosphate isomerase